MDVSSVASIKAAKEEVVAKLQGRYPCHLCKSDIPCAHLAQRLEDNSLQ